MSNTPEPFGRAALESLAIGTPVVGYDHGGAGEVLKKLFPQGCVHQGKALNLINKLLPLLDNPTVDKDSLDHFQLVNTCKQVLSLYQNVARA